MTPNALRSRLAFVAKQYPKVLNETAYVVAHTVGVDRDAVASATERGEDLSPLFGNDRHPAEALIPWVAKELHKLRKAIARDEMSSRDFDAAVSALESKLPAIATWADESRPDLTQLTMAEALQAIVTFEPENTAPVPQGEIIYRFADGWSVQELLTAEQVYPEGVAVQNCLRRDRSGPEYCKRIDEDEIRIFSLRTPRGEPRVSMMFEIDEDSKHGGRFEEIFAKQNTSLNATLEDTGDEALWAGIQKYKPRVQEFIRESFSAEPIGMMKAGAAAKTLDLRGANLIEAELYGADLSIADLRGANLTGADLRGADLRGADLTGANLSGATLIHAKLRGVNLRDANLRSADLRATNLSDARLTGADLANAFLTDAELIRANLSNATLIAANLQDAKMHEADLTGANMTGANLRGANLRGANLEGANMISANMISANMADTNMIGTNLMNADLRATDLDSADMTGANLRDTDLRRANLRRTNLTNANLTSVLLIGTTLTSANLTGADMTRADLRDANLTHADLAGANLTDADLSGAHMTRTKHNESTVWPQGFAVDSIQPNRRTSKRASKRTSKRTSRRTSKRRSTQ